MVLHAYCYYGRSGAGKEKSNDGFPHTQSGTSLVGLDTGLRSSAARGIRPGGQGAYLADLPCSMVPCRSNILPSACMPFIRRGAQHGRAVVSSTLHCLARRYASGDSLHNISVEQ